ncbi:hypothetical protein TL16_g02230 [Triparma laevis f. inornata]|uniref:Prolyl 4-hydroxylase alpha subunit domain-containing protein n=1 Tax=Triparma laevis f. inornata TaxID=1714386 RepID=A0A9W6ZT14_9STRA|nr:hypothetical protein TL16_g02230 [Triparma laevis f. inornata]
MFGSLICKAIFYPLLLTLSIITFWGASSSYTLYLVEKQVVFRRKLLREYQDSHGSGLTITPSVTQLTTSPPMWRVSNFLSPSEISYLKAAYLPTLTSCFPGAPETLVWWLGRWSSYGSIRVCQEMNQDLERGKEKGNEVLEAIELRILETLKKAGLYSGEDGKGNGFYTDTMDMQIVRYRRGGKFRYHFDEDFSGNALPLTFMIYLSHKMEGGGYELSEGKGGGGDGD